VFAHGLPLGDSWKVVVSPNVQVGHQPFECWIFLFAFLNGFLVCLFKLFDFWNGIAPINPIEAFPVLLLVVLPVPGAFS